MRLRSLGWSSDLALIDGEIVDRGDYLVVKSPDQPGYYWGNLLVFPAPPKAGEQSDWETLFAEEFSDMPLVKHRTFAWDLADKPADVQSFADSGYHHEKTVVLTTRQVRAPRYVNDELEIRELSTQDEWDAVAELQVASRAPEHKESAYREFVDRRLAALRFRVEGGQGEWYGAYLEGQQVGNLGIIRTGKAARFQIVVTHPEWRRRGVCGTLVHRVARHTLGHPDVESLVMLADTDYHAARIYESVGFEPTETIEGLSLWPPS